MTETAMEIEQSLVSAEEETSGDFSALGDTQLEHLIARLQAELIRRDEAHKAEARKLADEILREAGLPGVKTAPRRKGKK